MSTELKIGVLLGIVVVVGAAIFLVGGEEAEPELEVVLPRGETGETEGVATPGEPEVTRESVEPEAVEEPVVPEVRVVTVPAPVAEPVVVEKPEPAGPRYHIVRANETLSSISKKYYGQEKHWGVIYKANSQIIKDPDKLTVGWRLRIPLAREVAN